MKVFRYFITVLVICSLSFPVRGQIHQATANAPADTIDFVRERALIPGQTMGQKMESLLFWSVPEKERRFPNMQKIFPSAEVSNGSHIYTLTEGKSIQPKWGDGTTVDSYIRENHTAGVIVLKDDQIRLEAYGKGVDKHTLWTSFSVAKSVTSMLLSIALKRGEVQRMDDPLSKYIPELRGRDYGKVTVKQLLTMTSGIDWNEDYADHHSDVAQMYLQPCVDSEAHILTYMKNLKSVHEPGTVWNYSTGETDLLGILVQKATGKSLATYLSETIWQPWGMEEPAWWLADECNGVSIGGSGLSATLRDYARLGTVMLQNGKDGENDLFAGEWLRDATSLLYPTGEGGGGYGYLWWRFPNGSYAAIGIFGQMVYVNPKKNLVIVQIAAWPEASSKALTNRRQQFIEAVERVW